MHIIYQPRHQTTKRKTLRQLLYITYGSIKDTMNKHPKWSARLGCSSEHITTIILEKKSKEIGMDGLTIRIYSLKVMHKRGRCQDKIIKPRATQLHPDRVLTKVHAEFGYL